MEYFVFSDLENKLYLHGWKRRYNFFDIVFTALCEDIFLFDINHSQRCFIDFFKFATR